MGITGRVSQNSMYSQTTPIKPPVSVQPLLTNIIRQIAVSTLHRFRCLPKVCIASIPARCSGDCPLKVHSVGRENISCFRPRVKLSHPDNATVVSVYIDRTGRVTCENILILRKDLTGWVKTIVGGTA